MKIEDKFMSDVCIKVCASRAEAEILQELLEEEEIDADIITDDGGGNSSPMPASCGFCLMVDKDDRERALHILHTQGGKGFKKPCS
jgi:hypothetical protein